MHYMENRDSAHASSNGFWGPASPSYLTIVIAVKASKPGVCLYRICRAGLPRVSLCALGLAIGADFLANDPRKTIHWSGSVSIRRHVNGFGSLPAIVPFLIVVAKQIHRKVKDSWAEVELQLEGAAVCITNIQREISVAQPLGRRHEQ